MAFEVFKPGRRMARREATWRRWVADEDAVLVEMVSRNESTIAIARRLGRTPEAVQTRIWRTYGGPTGRPRGGAAASNGWRPS